jgi:hypothetical protein
MTVERSFFSSWFEGYILEILRPDIWRYDLNIGLLSADVRNIYIHINYGFPTFFRTGPQPLFWAGLRAARIKITVSDVPNLPN